MIFDPLFAGTETKAQFKGPDMTMLGNAVSAAAVLFAWGESFRMTELLAGVLLIVVLTILVNEALRWLEDARRAHKSRA